MRHIADECRDKQRNDIGEHLEDTSDDNSNEIQTEDKKRWETDKERL